MTLLPQLLEREDFTLLRHYLTDDSDKRKLFQLSSKAADLFDQYLVYRPDWLAQWETGHLVEGLGEAQAWQAPLWKALVEYTHELGQPRWHRANLYQRFIETLESATTCPPGLPSRVFICGISALPPVYLQALQALGKHIEIHLLFTNPCRYYWGDIKDPAYLAKLLTRQRRHSFEDRELPLFRDSENAGQLFNSDGEQDVGNRYWPPGVSLGATTFISFLIWRAARSWTLLSMSRQITCCITFSLTFWNWKTAPLLV